MRKTAIAAVAVGMTLPGLTGSAFAGEPVDGPTGPRCGFVSASNPLSGPGVQTGEIHGGPLAIVDAAGNVGSGTLTCTIQVNSAIHNGTSNDAVSVSAHGDGVVGVPPPVVVSYLADEDDAVYLCTQFKYDNGPTLYYHDSNNPTDHGHWSLDPNSTCRVATRMSGNGVVESIYPMMEVVGSVLCPVLISVFPPEGDIPGVGECPSDGDESDPTPSPTIRFVLS